MKISILKSLSCVLVAMLLAVGSPTVHAEGEATRMQAAPAPSSPPKGPDKLAAPKRDPAGYSCTIEGLPGWCHCQSIQDCGRLAASGKCKTPIENNPSGGGKSCEI